MYIGWGFAEKRSSELAPPNASRDVAALLSDAESAAGRAGACSRSPFPGRTDALWFGRNLIVLLDISLDLKMAGAQFSRRINLSGWEWDDNGTFVPKLQIP